jgi:hypothetical protein
MRVGRRRFQAPTHKAAEGDESFGKGPQKLRTGIEKSPDPHQETGLWEKCAPNEMHPVDTRAARDLTSFLIS